MSLDGSIEQEGKKQAGSATELDDEGEASFKEDEMDDAALREGLRQSLRQKRPLPQPIIGRLGAVPKHKAAKTPKEEEQRSETEAPSDSNPDVEVAEPAAKEEADKDETEAPSDPNPKDEPAESEEVLNQRLLQEIQSRHLEQLTQDQLPQYEAMQQALLQQHQQQLQQQQALHQQAQQQAWQQMQTAWNAAAMPYQVLTQQQVTMPQPVMPQPMSGPTQGMMPQQVHTQPPGMTPQHITWQPQPPQVVVQAASTMPQNTNAHPGEPDQPVHPYGFVGQEAMHSAYTSSQWDAWNSGQEARESAYTSSEWRAWNSRRSTDPAWVAWQGREGDSSSSRPPRTDQVPEWWQHDPVTWLFIFLFFSCGSIWPNPAKF